MVVFELPKVFITLSLFINSSFTQAFGVSPTSSSVNPSQQNTNIMTRSTLSKSSSSSLFVATSPDTDTTLIPPSDIATENIPELFEENVYKTYGRYPLTIASGSGCTLTDTSQKTYLDFVAGIATCGLGHSNAELTKAITQQMDTVHHVSNLYYIPGQAKLASWLVRNSCADKVFFCNSGAEANEGAIKLARKWCTKVVERDDGEEVTDPVIITAIQSFHGRTLAALTATGQPKYHNGFTFGGSMVDGFQYVKYNDVEDLKRVVEEAVTTPDELKKQGRKRGLAAIMLEPLQGEGGIIPGTTDFFQTARQLCDEHNALLMLDEVQVGMGRSGTLWGHQQFLKEDPTILPDVFTSAKALGGGVPIGAMCARGKASEVFQPGDHASTYGGNPLACAAGLAVAQYYSDYDVMTNVRERGEQLMEGLRGIAKRYSKILNEDVRGWGLILGVPVREDAGVTAGELVGDAMSEGLLLVPAGPSVVRFVPPLIVSKEEIDQALDIFERTVAKYNA